MMKRYMTLKVNLEQFLDEKGAVSELTDQAKKVFKFLTEIVLTVSTDTEQPVVFVDLKCNSRAVGLTCQGSIEASCINSRMIDWHCDSCEVSGTISNWQGSLWDRKKRIMH